MLISLSFVLLGTTLFLLGQAAHNENASALGAVFVLLACITPALVN